MPTGPQEHVGFLGILGLWEGGSSGIPRPVLLRRDAHMVMDPRHGCSGEEPVLGVWLSALVSGEAGVSGPLPFPSQALLCLMMERGVFCLPGPSDWPGA